MPPRKTPEEKAKKIADNRAEKQASREQKTREFEESMENELGKMTMMASWDDEITLPRHGYDPTLAPVQSVPGTYEPKEKKGKGKKEMTPEEARELKAEQEMWLWDAELALEDDAQIEAEMYETKTRKARNAEFLDRTAQLEGFKISQYGAKTFYDWLVGDISNFEEHIKRNKKAREVNFLPVDIVPYKKSDLLREEFERYMRENSLPAEYVPDDAETKAQAKARAKAEKDQAKAEKARVEAEAEAEKVKVEFERIKKAQAQAEIDKAFLEEMRALEIKQLKNQPPLPSAPRPVPAQPPLPPMPRPKSPPAPKVKKPPTAKAIAKAEATALAKAEKKANKPPTKAQLKAQAKAEADALAEAEREKQRKRATAMKAKADALAKAKADAEKAKNDALDKANKAYNNRFASGSGKKY